MRVTDAIELLEELLHQLGDVEVVFDASQGKPVEATKVKNSQISPATAAWINSYHGRN